MTGGYRFLRTGLAAATVEELVARVGLDHAPIGQKDGILFA